MMELGNVLPNVLSVMMKITARNVLTVLSMTMKKKHVGVNLDSLKLSVENV